MNTWNLIANAVIDGVNDAVEGSGAGENSDAGAIAQNIINAGIVVIGIVAVGAILLGAFRMQASQGDSAKVKKAKDTIMYGIIGLVVAILAFAIVNFVLTSIF